MKSLYQMVLESQQAEFNRFNRRSLEGNPNAKRGTLNKDSVRSMKLGGRSLNINSLTKEIRSRTPKKKNYINAMNQGISRAVKINLIGGVFNNPFNRD